MKAWNGLTLALVALLVAVGTAEAGGPSTLPPKFPYAAEIQATVHYDGTYSLQRTGYQRCPTGEGEVKVATREVETLHIERTATFSHITVPVATAHELGRAAAKLGLEPTITTPGKISQDHSTLDLEDSLVVPNPESEGCAATPVDCHWDLAAVPGSGLQDLSAGELGDELISWNLNLLGVNKVTGDPCPVAEGQGALSAALASSRNLYPKGLTNFPEVVISRALGNDFRELRDHQRVSFNPGIQTPGSGMANCATHLSEEEETCTDSVSGRADVELRRLFLYKTKRAYLR